MPGTFKEGDLAAVIETVEARAVMVHSSCGMDEQLYKEHLELPGLFNLRLRVRPFDAGHSRELSETQELFS